MNQKILITDKVIDYLLELLHNRGFDYIYKPNISHNELLSSVKDYNVLIVRSRTKVSRAIIERGVNLKAIIRFGVGLDNIDLEATKEYNIKVFNTPEAFTEAVAELTLGLILGVSRNLGYAHYSLKNGKWEKKKLYGYEILNKNVAIIGFGRIGRRVAELLKPFNVNIKIYDVIRFPKEFLSKYDVIQVDNIEEAVEDADIITLHVPITPETKEMFNINLFRKMKRKPFLINTSRGGIIKYDDLLKALNERLIRGCALDVYPYEPFKDEKILNRNDVFLTPHIGAQTYEANRRAAEEVINILENLLKE